MRLAWQCGKPHPRHLLQTLTARELLDVETFAENEPLPERRADLRAAMQTLIAAKAAGASGAELSDFLLDYDAAHAEADADDQEMSEQEIDRQLQKLAGLYEAMTAGQDAGGGK